MKELSFEDAKQAVAEKRGYKNWWDIPVAYDDSELYAEAAELYASAKSRKAANEAVKADRKQIADELDFNELEYKGNVIDTLGYINSCFPLPFPEESL